MASRPRFNLKNKADDPSLIIMVFRIRGKRIVHSTSLSVSPKHWNDKTMRVRELARNRLEAESINSALSKYESIATEIARGFTANSEIPSVEQFKQQLAFRVSGGKKSSQKSFTAFIETFIQERTSKAKVSSATIKVYKTAQNHYNRFNRSRNIEFKDVTVDHLDRFITYLWQKKFGTNHVNKIITTIKTMLNDAVHKGLTSNLDFRSRTLSVPKRDSDNIYLNIDDLKRMEELDLLQSPRLERARDQFLLGAYTGLRFSDFTKLTLENLKRVDGKDIFRVIPQKTKVPVDIPCHSVVRRILNQYDGQPPKEISIQKLNEYLKEIGQKMGLKEIVSKRVDPGGRIQEQRIPKWSLLSSHTARRSFATNTYLAGIDPLSIMKITGHKQYSTFMKYIRVTSEENAVKMAEHPFFRNDDLTN